MIDEETSTTQKVIVQFSTRDELTALHKYTSGRGSPSVDTRPPQMHIQLRWFLITRSPHCCKFAIRFLLPCQDDGRNAGEHGFVPLLRKVGPSAGPMGHTLDDPTPVTQGQYLMELRDSVKRIPEKYYPKDVYDDRTMVKSIRCPP